MILKNDLLAYFWANANQVVTPEGIEIDLHNDEVITLSISLKNVDNYPYTIQLHAEMSIDEVATEMEAQLLDNLAEIDLKVMFALLLEGRATYEIYKV